jgi:hypothetical protein
MRADPWAGYDSLRQALEASRNCPASSHPAAGGLSAKSVAAKCRPAGAVYSSAVKNCNYRVPGDA